MSISAIYLILGGVTVMLGFTCIFAGISNIRKAVKSQKEDKDN